MIFCIPLISLILRKEKQERRILLTISAFPKMLLYLFVIFILYQDLYSNQNLYTLEHFHSDYYRVCIWNQFPF